MSATTASKFVAYIRVSTQRQGQSGLGLDAQRLAVENYAQGRGQLVGEFVEVESGRSGGANRPELEKAIKECRHTGSALVFGKLDRLARNVRFFLQVIDDSGVEVRFADLPDVCPSTDEGRMLLISMANFAEFEGRRISTRTKAALAAAKARGTELGVTGPANLKANIEERQLQAQQFAARLSPVIRAFRADGLSQRRQVERLNEIGIKAPRGGTWSLVQLQRLTKNCAL